MDFPHIPVKTEIDVTGFHSIYYFEFGPTFYHTPEQHDFWEIVYVMSGEVECAEDERVYRLRDRNIVFHAPMEFHKIRSLPGSNPHILILTFSAEGLPPAELKEGVFSVSLEEQDKLYAIVSSAIRFLHTTEPESLDIQLAALHLSAFILRLTTNQRAKDRFSQSRSANEYHKVVVTMAEGIRQNLTLSDIAKKCNISISYIKTLFARYSGISPKTYYANTGRNVCK
jgi:methylphosphotriester-DNA--protein-cysteine methyltransferase/quercetin dioxygenase-like cupin family protein